MGAIHYISECSTGECPFFHCDGDRCICFLGKLNGFVIDLSKKKNCIDKAPPDTCPLFEYGKSGVVLRMNMSVNRRQTCRG